MLSPCPPFYTKSPPPAPWPHMVAPADANSGLKTAQLIMAPSARVCKKKEGTLLKEALLCLTFIVHLFSDLQSDSIPFVVEANRYPTSHVVKHLYTVAQTYMYKLQFHIIVSCKRRPIKLNRWITRTPVKSIIGMSNAGCSPVAQAGIRGGHRS